MEASIEREALDTLPRPLTLKQELILRTCEATGKIPYQYQVRNALALLSGRDVLCVAGTGSGKTLSFIMTCFLRSDIITWTVSPLNYIENQQCEQFRSGGYEIKAGKYQVVISSPEAYQDANKLRPALLSKELEDFTHVTVVDEAHCIKLWGSDFHKAYERIGHMHVFMFTPQKCPLIAATATASDPVKAAIISSLDLRNGFHFENLGNFWQNILYEVHQMRKGQESYNEVCDVLPSAQTPIQDVKQTIIFVEDYPAAHSVATAVRKYFGLSGKEAQDKIPVYHSLISENRKRCIERQFKNRNARILISTEALTMGADFPNVKLIINFLAPESLECWVQ
ncbi:P-loop containing nucleoside triphosphate hydrolase protein [Ceratobasidium sp. AG-I]|nr:P-loop containing nucleoside triphosphate hydrolase protein [Ceratobasidium sp. AG-I]